MQCVEAVMIFSLVIPVYRNEGSIPELLRALEQLDRQMAGELEAVFVVDGSPDRSAELLAGALPAVAFRSQLLVLSKNFGAFAAVTAGLAHARGELFGVMAADLQEPPDLILQFREQLLTRQYDVVVGTRSVRGDPLGQRTASAIFWFLYRHLVQREIPPGGADVFACNRQFRDQLLALRERNSTLVGLLFWMGFRRGEVQYARRQRTHGRSAWSFPRRLRYLLDSTFAFSDLPVRILSAVGLAGVMLSLVLASVVLLAKLTGRIRVPGYTATVLVVMFFGGLNSLGLGILGEYLWRTFENTKGRPPYIVSRHEQFQPQRHEP
jgi:glycosyltransferase involved in cell wall biosynthesis